jgi:hypothetical protein
MIVLGIGEVAQRRLGGVAGSGKRQLASDFDVLAQASPFSLPLPRHAALPHPSCNLVVSAREDHD